MNILLSIPSYFYMLSLIVIIGVALAITVYGNSRSKRYLKGPWIQVPDSKRQTALFINLIHSEWYHCCTNVLSTGLGTNEIEFIFNRKKRWHIINRETVIKEVMLLRYKGDRAVYRRVLPYLLEPGNKTERLFRLKEKFWSEPNYDEIMETAVYLYGHHDKMINHPVFPFTSTALEKGIIGWDMAELVLLVRMTYDLGYLSEEEAWLYIEDAYKLIREEYYNWQEFAMSLVIGFACNHSNFREFSDFLRIVENAFQDENSPWLHHDFNPSRESLIIFESTNHPRKSFPFFKMMACVWGICVMVGFTGCNGNSEKAKGNSPVVEDTKTVFEVPEVPVSLQTAEERVAYLMQHYWDHFDFNDTSLMHKPEITEQAFANFVYILNGISQPLAIEGIQTLLQRTEKNWDMQHYFIIDLFGKYLYDPNSPLRNEELYIPVLEYIEKSATIKSEYKITAEYRLKNALKNRPGQYATDFTFADHSGRLRKLSDTKNEYILLFFNNPGCHACHQVIDQLKESSFSHHPQLTILSIYPDKDLEEWKKAENDFPPDWINGYSPEGFIMEKEIYDLKAIPTLYLLDNNKVVLLKDATWEQIETYLKMNL
ncbi:DUF5106 domain-containing protein [Bacteroides fragilis]|uniref:DUF5106 domain-containing protein n=1 Tax=Bacteroides fragilis TaxID=817 RepID=A0A396C6L3_BACFG|nr:DUF5106 domain-containing protein [Bacteroides fragilis]RHH14344.1 DUF5106 domain-containing protein [Bacteroides fragilis]